MRPFISGENFSWKIFMKISFNEVIPDNLTSDCINDIATNFKNLLDVPGLFGRDRALDGPGSWPSINSGSLSSANSTVSISLWSTASIFTPEIENLFLYFLSNYHLFSNYQDVF